MSLNDFIIQHGLRKAREDKCNDMNIVGKRGDIYEHGNGLLAAMILHAPTSQHWNKYRNLAAQLGCRVIQNGDTEGAFTFDPENHEQAELAIRAVRASRKRKMSLEFREKLTQAGAGTRFYSRKRDVGMPDE